MVELTQKTIDAIQVISEAVKQTDFYINHMMISKSGTDKIIIELDIRENSDEVKTK